MKKLVKFNFARAGVHGSFEDFGILNEEILKQIVIKKVVQGRKQFVITSLKISNDERLLNNMIQESTTVREQATVSARSTIKKTNKLRPKLNANQNDIINLEFYKYNLKLLNVVTEFQTIIFLNSKLENLSTTIEYSNKLLQYNQQLINDKSKELQNLIR